MNHHPPQELYAEHSSACSHAEGCYTSQCSTSSHKSPLAPQELYAEYFSALSRPGTPLKTFRVKVYVFPALQFETMYAAPEAEDVEARWVQHAFVLCIVVKC